MSKTTSQVRDFELIIAALIENIREEILHTTSDFNYEYAQMSGIKNQQVGIQKSSKLLVSVQA